jgi:hypothetical protein
VIDAVAVIEVVAVVDAIKLGLTRYVHRRLENTQ